MRQVLDFTVVLYSLSYKRQGESVMKYLRAMILMVCFMFIMYPNTKVSASEKVVPEMIQMQEGVLDYSFDIVITNEQAYAGSEFAVSCPNGYQISKVTYSVQGNTAGPVVARGYTWFSYFSGKNDYSGEVTATVFFTADNEVTEQDEVQFVLSQIKQYTVTDTIVDTLLGEPNLTVIVKQPLQKSPVVKDVKEEEVKEEIQEEIKIPQGTIEISPVPTKKPKPTKVPDQSNITESLEDGVQEITPTAIPTPSITIAPTISPTVVPTPEVNKPVEVVEEDSTPLGNLSQGQDSKSQSLNWFLLIALIVSLMGNVVLGYLMQYYKKNGGRRK